MDGWGSESSTVTCRYDEFTRRDPCKTANPVERLNPFGCSMSETLGGLGKVFP